MIAMLIGSLDKHPEYGREANVLDLFAHDPLSGRSCSLPSRPGLNYAWTLTPFGLTLLLHDSSGVLQYNASSSCWVRLLSEQERRWEGYLLSFQAGRDGFAVLCGSRFADSFIYLGTAPSPGRHEAIFWHRIRHPR
jgi:hypothetical protein